mgnify:CR=1 FL=1
MESKKAVQHVYLVGAKSMGAYGGYETFVYKLTEYHQKKDNIKYHVACKANGDGCMDESKFEGVTKINDHEFEFHNRCAIVISLLTDILALTQGSIDGNYFVGTKFAVVYQHLFLLTLFMMVNSSSLMKKNSLNNYRVRFTFYALLILTIILSLYVDCMTGVIGTALFFVFSLLVRYNSKMMASGGMFIGAVLASFAFMWVVPSILLNENVASFITNKLNRSLSLTGRTLIFERIPQIMQGKWLLGFGYGSSYEICRRYIGFADTQNALMEWIMQIGVLGSVLLCLMLCYCITRLNKNIMIYTEWVWPLAFVYTYVALGTIEITYSYQFVGALLEKYILMLIWPTIIEDASFLTLWLRILTIL